MEFDIKTLIIILGFTHLMQVIVFFHQYKVNKTYQGIGWWLLWSAAEVIGFGAMLLRGIPSILPLVIVVQNFMIVAGTVFLYIGVRKFSNKQVNLKLIFPILMLFAIGLLYFLLVDNNMQIRSAIINFTFAIISFITAYSLLFNKPRSVAATANFNAAVFIVHGSIFIYRTIVIIGGAPMENMFAPTLFNVLPYFDALIVSLLWTFGLIIMVNQRLHTEVLDSKEELQIIFNTSPDAAIITRLEDGLIVNFNEGYSAISGYKREEMVGKSTPEINIWKNLEDRNKVVNLLKEKEICENYEAEFLLKNGTTITGLLSAKMIKIHEVPHIISITRNITEHKQFEEEMQKSEKSFRLLFENMAEGVALHEMIYDQEGIPIDYRIIEVNSAFEKHTGISAQLACDTLATELYGVKIPPYLSEYNEVVLTKKPLSFETRFEGLNKDFSISAICTKPGYFATIFMDITESKIKEHKTVNLLESTEKSRNVLLSILEDQMQAQQMLQESEARFRSTFDQSPIGAVIVGLDKNFIRCNSTFAKYLGCTESELIGKSISDVTFMEDIDIGMPEMKQLVEGKIDSVKLQKRYLRKNGSIFWGEITMYLVRDENNKPIYFLPIIQDITERLQAETKLRESEEKFRNIFENSPIGNSLTTIDGTINTNQTFADMIGYSKQELKEIKWQKITHPDDFETTQQNMNLLIKGERASVRFLKRYIHKNNAVIWTDVSSFIQKDKAGNPLYFVTAINDITERKQLEEKLLKNKALLNEAEKSGKIGGWEFNVVTLTQTWTEETFRILEIDLIKGEPKVPEGIEFIDPEFRPMAKEAINRAIEFGEPYEQEWIITTEKGNKRWIHVIGRAQQKNGKTIIVSGSFQDITERKIAEEALKKAEVLYRSLTENSPDLIARYDRQYRHIYVNPSASKIGRYSLGEEYIGKTIYDVFVPAEGAAIWVKHVKTVFETGQSIEVDDSFQDIKGHRYLNTKFIPERDDKGNIISVLSIARDITERKLVQEALIQNEAHLSTLIDTIPDLVWLKDEKGVYLHCNKRFENFFGAPKEEIIGKTDYDFVDKELADFFREKDNVALIAEKPSVNEEQVTYANDGHTEILETIKMPIYKKTGQIIGVLGIGHNITERKQAENILKESERKLREAQEMAHLGFWSWNIKTGYVEWSEEVFKIFGLDSTNFIPQIDSILAFSPWPEDHQRDKELIDRAMETHSPGSYEQRFLRPDQSIGHYYSTFQGVYDEKNELVSIIGTVLDITERKIAEEEIKKLNETLEQKVKIRTSQLESAYAEMEAFSYSVSHDLRSPLRAINGFSKILLEDSEKLDTETLRLINKVSDNADNMSKLIEDLITYARVAKANIGDVPINMKDLIKSIITGNKNEISKQNIIINVGKIPELKGDCVLLTQVWANLIRNAVKFTSKTDNPEINIGGYLRENEVVYFIKDNGVGFNMRYVNKLFQVFERLHTSEEFEGTGIGLAIVKKAISMHGGRVWAEGVEGEGASFYFAIPIER